MLISNLTQNLDTSNVSQFEEACQRFDWQWYWRDSATVTAQLKLMSQANSLGNAYIVVYENYRLKARNPYCPLVNAKLLSTTSLENYQANHLLVKEIKAVLHVDQ